MSEMNLYKKLATARVELQKKNLKKTGYNSYSKYDYFQLDDFLPSINEIFLNLGLVSQFEIVNKKVFKPDTGEMLDNETATLTIIDTDNPKDTIVFQSPTADSGIKGASAIQILGGKHTYMRRYLWLEAMEIVEADAVDGLSNDDKVPAKKATKKIEYADLEDIEQINKLYSGEEIKAMLGRLNKDNVKQLTKAEVKKMVDARTGINDQTPTY